jgi:hypothetical protein
MSVAPVAKIALDLLISPSKDECENEAGVTCRAAGTTGSATITPRPRPPSLTTVVRIFRRT